MQNKKSNYFIINPDAILILTLLWDQVEICSSLTRNNFSWSSLTGTLCSDDLDSLSSLLLPPFISTDISLVPSVLFISQGDRHLVFSRHKHFLSPEESLNSVFHVLYFLLCIIQTFQSSVSITETFR